MKFPSYQGGATGSLVRANEFDQIAPPYASTTRGDITIKRNGEFLQVTRNAPAIVAVPPALYMQMVAGPDGWGQLFGPWPDAEQYDQIQQDATFIAWENVWNSTAHPLSFADGDSVHVGDGWVLERIPDNLFDLWFWESTCRALLRNVDEQASAPVLSLTIANNGRVSVLFDDVLEIYNSADATHDSMPSLVPMGWRDEARGYAFAVVGRSSDAADVDPSETGPSLRRLYRYAIYTGDTVTRRLTRTYMPDPASARRWWSWYEAREYQFVTRKRPTADRPVWVVGRGHLLTLAVERYELESGILEGVTNYAGRFGRIPVGTAPTLLRSRDFGATWTQEPATFLNEVNGTAIDTLTNTPDVNDPDTYTEYPSEVRQVFSNPNDFHAAHIGGGRIAIVAAGKSATPWPEFSDADVFEPALSLYFYVSNNGGSGFVRKAWPIDQLWLSLPTQDMLRGGGWRDMETPVWPLSSGTLSTFGPGSFFMVTKRYRLWTGTGETPVPREYGAYPEEWSFRVHYTQDYGDTWAVITLPQDLFHMRTTFADYKAFKAAELIDVWGTLEAVQPTPPYRFCVLEPSAPGRGPVLMATASEYASFGTTIERIVRSFVSDPKAGPFAGWREVDTHIGQYLDSHIGRLPPVPVYVGDDGLDEYPRKVRPGFAELDRP